MKRLLILALLLSSCDGKPDPTPPAQVPERDEIGSDKNESQKPEGEPDRVEVQLALIGVSPVEDRTKEEAKELAERLYKQVVDGADFPEIIRQYSVKKLRHPGGIGIINHGIKRLGNDFPRKYWGLTIGNAVFALEMGKFTLIPYGPKNRYGWFIIKRLK